MKCKLIAKTILFLQTLWFVIC